MDTIKVADSIDKVISDDGGFPRGHMFEIYGPNGEGKTTLLIIMQARAQQQGLKVGHIDLENSYNEDHAAFLGVNIEELDLVRPESGEEAMGEAVRMCREGYGLVGMDSVGGLVTRDELDNLEDNIGSDEFGSSGGKWAKIASLLANTLKFLNRAAIEGNTCVILLNQIRSNFNKGFGFGPTTESFGGYTLKHMVSARFEIRKIAWIKYGTKVIGFKLKIRAPKKNRFAMPTQEGILDIICAHDAPSLEKINKRKKTKIEPIGE